MDAAIAWNRVLFEAALIDSRKPKPNQEQPGPTRTSRVAALVHLAIHDAVTHMTTDPQFHTYQNPVSATPPSGATAGAAAAGAAHRVLSALYPSQVQSLFDVRLKTFGASMSGAGEQYGSAVADQLLASRQNDGADSTSSVVSPSALPNAIPWQPDPILAPPGPGLDPHWGNVDYFGIAPSNPSSLRPPAFPDPSGGGYFRSFAEVYFKGSEPSPPAAVPNLPPESPHRRTADEEQAALFWSYDDMLGTPIRLYNRHVREILAQHPRQNAGLEEHAWILALVNVAMADAGIACWESKYYYNIWRPFQGIRMADQDPNTRTTQDPVWLPLGRPRAPQGARNTTPNFPAYVSGHSSFGTAAFGMMRKIYGTTISPGAEREFKLNLTSEELPLPEVGETLPLTDADILTPGRDFVSRNYRNLGDVIAENGRSRIHLGVHWEDDNRRGIALGQQVADAVWASALTRNGA
jgi:hypothetical protein